MSILNINTLQDNFDLSTIGGYNKEYILQALANLGQRLSVKGDSVATKSMYFTDIFESININNYSNPEDYIGRIKVDSSNILFQIVDKISFAIKTTESLVNSNDYIVVDSSIKLDTKINNVDYYLPNGFIKIDQFSFYTCFVGVKVINKTEIYTEFTCLEFNKLSNKIVSGLRICKNNIKNISSSTGTIINDGYILLYLKMKDSLDKYDLIVHDDFKLILDNEEKINYQNSQYDKFKSFCDKVLKSSNSHAKTFSPEYFYKSISSYEITDLFRNSSESKSKAFREYELSSNNTNQFYLNHEDTSIRYPQINTKLNYFIYDLNVFYDFIKNYYSSVVYLMDNNDLKRQIFKSIFKKIQLFSTNASEIYIPINFSINYYCNSNNPWEIFGGVNNLSVQYINEEINKNNIDDLYKENHILCSTNIASRISLFNFIIEYDNNSENIFSINVFKNYTMPYINGDNFWVINESETLVKAKGQDAGNPNMIIVYNKSKQPNDFTILSGANKDNILNKISWKLNKTYIEPLENINTIDISNMTPKDLLTVNCWVPDLLKVSYEDKDEIFNNLKYSIIISVSSVNMIEEINNSRMDEIYEKYGEYGVITSFWSMNEETEEFEPILRELNFGANYNVALDIDHLTNMNNLVKWHVKNAAMKTPDKYTHKWLVLDNSYVTLKNFTLDYKTYIYGNIENLTSINFNSTEYKNDLNLFVKYNTGIIGAEEDDITSINMTEPNKYLIFDNNQRTEVTNALHSYESGKSFRRYAEFDINSNVPVLNTSEILLQNTNVINRVNLIGVSSYNSTTEGFLYNSYIGTSFDDVNKYRLHIGSSYTNINIGTNTLMNKEDINKFKTQRELHLDFPNTYLNGYTYVQDNINILNDVFVNHEIYDVKNVNEVNTYTLTHKPISKLIITKDSKTDKLDSNGQVFNIEPIQLNNIKDRSKLNDKMATEEQINNFEKSKLYNQFKHMFTMNNGKYNYENWFDYKNPDNTKLWMPTLYYFDNNYLDVLNNTFLYLGESIFIPSLLFKLRLFDYINPTKNNVVLTTNNKVINVKFNVLSSGKENIPDVYPLFMMTSNKFITDFSSRLDENFKTNNNTLYTFTLKNDNVYIGNPLDITYYEKVVANTKILYINIQECHASNRIDNLFKIYPNEKQYFLLENML